MVVSGWHVTEEGENNDMKTGVKCDSCIYDFLVQIVNYQGVNATTMLTYTPYSFTHIITL